MSASGWLDAARQSPSPHQDHRPQGSTISLLVIHYISLPPNQFGGDDILKLFAGTLDTRSRPDYAELEGLRVSAHFLIRRDGSLIQFVSCLERAWHAGISSWQGQDNCNDFSIGIELEGGEIQAFEEVQYQVLISLCQTLARLYPIGHVAGHCHVAPGRKTDPGPCFDWQRLQKALPQLKVAE
jgi:AmpD protein